jgi:hypothetical protein
MIRDHANLSFAAGGGNDELNADGGKSIRLVKFV